MIAHKCAESRAQNICAVIPYLAYARQDRAFLEGEVISVAVVEKLLQATGIKDVITVDIHSRLAMTHFSKVSIDNISSIAILAEYASSKLNLQKAIAVSPDAGGAERAREFAKCMNIDMISLKKSRDRNTGEVFVDEKLDADITGRDVILIDDIISSGSSIIKATEVLHKRGAKKIYVMCAHGLLLGNAATKISAAGAQDIIATNSVPGKYAQVDLSSIIAEALRFRYSS